MAQQSQAADKTPSFPWLNAGTSELAAIGKKRWEEIAEVQSELLDELQQANRGWLDRMQSEVTLASEFTSKLATSHSLSDTTSACQEWAKRRMELFAEDGKRLMSNSQKIMEKTSRLLANNWLSEKRPNGG